MQFRREIPLIHPILKQTLGLCVNDPRTGRQLCADAGVAHNLFQHWVNRKNGATVATVEALLGTLGYELKIVKKTRKSCARKESPPLKTLKIDEVLSGMFDNDQEADDARR